METQSDSANHSEDRSKTKRFSKDTSFSLRSPLTKTHRDWEQSSPQRGRYKNRQRGSHRPRNTDDRRPTLAQFAPELTRLHSSPKEGASFGRGSARARDVANRKTRSEAKDASFSLRSPLDRKSETHAKGHGSGGKRQAGSQRSQTGSQSSSKTSPKELEKDTTDSHGTARKCLWADDVDEAFVDGDNLDDEAFGDDIELDEEERADSSETESPRPPLTKQQLARREKDITYGKVTQGYLNYVQQIPKHKRDKNCPRTPNKMANNYSRRKWDSLVHQWRRHLHQWDNSVESCADDDSTSEESTPLKGRLHCADVDCENRTPSPRKHLVLSSTRSSPSDLGYVTTPDSKANLSYQQLDDDIDSLPEHDDVQHFPPLVSTGVASSSPVPLPTKGAWTLSREDSESKAKAENDSLNEFAWKLTISDGVKAGGHDMPE